MSAVVLVALVLTQCAAVLLVMSSVSHARHPHALGAALRTHALLPGRLAPLVVRTLPWAQLVVGTAAIVAAFPAGAVGRVSAGLLGGVFAVFTGYLALLVQVRGGHQECACPGAATGNARSARRRSAVFTVSSAVVATSGADVVTSGTSSWVLAGTTLAVGSLLAVFAHLIPTEPQPRQRQLEGAT